jgi:hypothetical protein
VRGRRTLAGLTEVGKETVHGYESALCGHEDKQDALSWGFKLYDSFVGLYFGDDFADRDRVSLTFEPANDGPFEHVEAHLGHCYGLGHGTLHRLEPC